MITVKIYKVSEAIASDVARINALNKQLRSNDVGITFQEFKEFLQQKNVFLVVARDTNTSSLIFDIFPSVIIGKASLHITVLDDGTRKATVEQVVVEGAYRGRGFGVADSIDDELYKIAKENMVSYIDLTSNPSRIAANKFYLRRGYERRETNVYRKIVK